MLGLLLRRTLGALFVALVLGVLVAGCRTLSPPNRPAVEPDTVSVLWAGAVTDASARVVARPVKSGETVRLAVDTSGTWADPRFLDGTQPATNPDVSHFRLTGLAPRTTYHYALAIGGQIDTTQSGRFRTFADGPFSFRVALGGCARTGSEHPVFTAIRRAHPDLFLHLGDMHYENIDVAEAERFRNAYRRVHASARQSALFRSTALAYVWDDHDYGPNNSTRRAPGQDASQQVYREYVPHYELAPEALARPIYQVFTIGRVRFLLTDLRSARTPPGVPDSVQTMMGAEQKAWFKEQIARAADRYPVIAWVSSVPWIGDDEDAEDRWPGFAEERHELATYIDSVGAADQLVLLSGDAHMVALDDGTHNHYGQDGGGGFPVVQAAALDQDGSVKGGPYTHGPYPNPIALFGRTDGQFVVMDVRDEGGEDVCITWTGKRYETSSAHVVDLLQWKKCFGVP